MTEKMVKNEKGQKETNLPESGESPVLSERQRNKDKGTVQLKREVGLVRGVALIVGGMIGSGIFISPKGILLGTNSVGMSLVVWVVCAVVSTLAALCYIELGIIIPRAGGTYQYILHAYGDLAGFMYAWAKTVIMSPAGNALVAITLGTYIADYVTPGDCAPPREAIQLFAIIAMTLMIFINCVSVRCTTGLLVVFTAAKVTALIIIIVVGLVKLFQGETQYLDPEVSFVGTTTSILGYGTALYFGFWPYLGWDNLNDVAEELKNPERDLPLAIGIAMPTVTAIYLLTNIAYFTTLSPTELLASSAVAVTFAERTLGSMAWLIPLGVCISTGGNLLGALMTGPRMIFAAGREGHLIRLLSMVTVKWSTPLPAVSLQGTLAIILILVGDFRSLIMYRSIVQWIFLGASFAAVLVLRRKYPNKPRPFKVNILVPIVATLTSVFMVLAPVISEPHYEYLYALVLLALGLVVYIVLVRGKRQLPFMDHMTLFIQKLFLVSPSRSSL